MPAIYDRSVMKSTRDLMRDLLAANREATVFEIASTLGLNQANIRRHLEVMRAEGLVDVTMRRSGIGRPSYVYRLTERAEEMSAHYPRLVDRMVRKLATRPDAGPLLTQLFDGVADDVAGAHMPMVKGTTIADRVAETSVALKDEGIVDHWRQEDDGFHLLNTTCPYMRAAEASDAPCHADHKVVQTLIGAPVEQVTRIIDGHHACEYVVRAEAKPVAKNDATSAGSF
jgi:DeoR family transcriptional regulator, suf operon transcriptional repressor